MEDKTNKSNKFEEKSQLGVILKFIIEIGEEMKAQVHSDFTTVLRIVPIPIREVCVTKLIYNSLFWKR